MRDEEEKAMLEQVFGPSSSEEEEEEEEEECETECNNWDWESIEEVNGLWLCKHFLSPLQQSHILSSIQADNWFPQPSINQAMRFGLQHLPFWSIRLSQSIRRSLLASNLQQQPLPLHLLLREPLFDQMIANVYYPGQGICPHVDLLRFDDGIAILSLESSCVMHFTPVSQTLTLSVPVLLTPGSLVLLSGEARYHWKHEINRRPGFQLWQGQQLTQTRRTSITLRKLSSSTSTP